MTGVHDATWTEEAQMSAFDRWTNDRYDRAERVAGATPIAEMFYPMRCLRCSAIYDGGKVTVTARYADCSVWVSPCCRQTVDDRPRGWGGGAEPLRGSS